MFDLSKISDWKDFERLCADLLEAEGFSIDLEPYVDRTGVDIVASCEYRAHAPSLPAIRVRWFVQCKHYAPSGTNLGRSEIETMLTSYNAARGKDDGLLIILSTDYTEPAANILAQFLQSKPDAKVMLWNRRHVFSLLDRHKHLPERYGLYHGAREVSFPKTSLRILSDKPVLIVSDQSAFAHDLCSLLRNAGVQVYFLPVWNYSSDFRLDLLVTVLQRQEFALAAVFLGDSFGVSFPYRLEKFLLRIAEDGGSLLFFPFSAWLIERAHMRALSHAIPVRLAPSSLSRGHSMRARALSSDRALSNMNEGDFRNLLAETTFEEDEYIECKPNDHSLPFDISDIELFGISHSYEHLIASPLVTHVLQDRNQNPFVVTGYFEGAKVAYINSCCHSCMTSTAVPSPLSIAPQFQQLVERLLLWLVTPANSAAARSR
jgi:Restriction endonuclease